MIVGSDTRRTVATSSSQSDRRVNPSTRQKTPTAIASTVIATRKRSQAERFLAKVANIRFVVTACRLDISPSFANWHCYNATIGVLLRQLLRRFRRNRVSGGLT